MNLVQSGSSGNLTAESGAFKITIAGREDVQALVDLHLRCFTGEDHIAVMFGRRFIHTVYYWFLTNAKNFVLVVKENRTNRLIGFMAISEGAYNAPMLRAAKWDALRGVARRPWLIVHPELIRRFVRMIFPSRKFHMVGKFAQIAFTGVEPEFRGLGISKALKLESTRVCRELGMDAIVTGVKKDNSRARAMNEGAGFVEVPEWRTKRFIYLKLDLR
jgi:ribosomal protein S18 acetylase RimI-like enzyme